MSDRSIHIEGSVGPGTAIGHGSSGHYEYTAGGGQGDEVRRLLEELAGQIRSHQSELVNLQELNDSLEVIRAELAKPEPQKSILTVVLRGIAASAGGVTAVAEAARNVLQLFK